MYKPILVKMKMANTFYERWRVSGEGWAERG
jgi:hypothetical protein